MPRYARRQPRTTDGHGSAWLTAPMAKPATKRRKKRSAAKPQPKPRNMRNTRKCGPNPFCFPRIPRIPRFLSFGKLLQAAIKLVYCSAERWRIVNPRIALIDANNWPPQPPKQARRVQNGNNSRNSRNSRITSQSTKSLIHQSLKVFSSVVV